MEDKMYLRQKVFTKKDIENQINGFIQKLENANSYLINKELNKAYDQWKEVYDELKLIQNETKLVRTEKKNENSFFFDGYAILMLETVAKQNIKAPQKELSDNIDNALAELRYYVMQIKDVRITR
ncbi:hypothetical protein N8B94_05190 [Enterococcus faecium]